MFLWCLCSPPASPARQLGAFWVPGKQVLGVTNCVAPPISLFPWLKRTFGCPLSFFRCQHNNNVLNSFMESEWPACLPGASTGSILGPRKRCVGRLEWSELGPSSTSWRYGRVSTFFDNVLAGLPISAPQKRCFSRLFLVFLGSVLLRCPHKNNLLQFWYCFVVTRLPPQRVNLEHFWVVGKEVLGSPNCLARPISLCSCGMWGFGRFLTMHQPVFHFCMSQTIPFRALKRMVMVVLCGFFRCQPKNSMFRSFM